MRCPYCQSDDDKVIDSRPADGGSAIRRRRVCQSCGRRYTTYERVEEMLQVVKRGNVKEAFDREKILGGLRKACEKLEVTEADIDSLAENIEEELKESGVHEIESKEIGRKVLQGLKGLNEVAYMRFSSVYKEFQSPEDFRRELNQLQLEKESPPKRGER